MIKSVKRFVSLAMATFMLLLITSCGSGTLMQNVFNELKKNEDYLQWKEMFPNTKIEEKVTDNSIVISTKGEEGINGDYTFSLDGDYIVNVSDESDYTGYSFMMYIKNAVASLYDMDGQLMSGYLAGLEAFGMENNYFLSDTTEGKTTIKLYAADKWAMEGLDEMYVNEKSLEFTDPLTQEDTSSYLNSGKIFAAMFGNKSDMTLVVGEYGKNTDLTLKSIHNIVSKLQPIGCETFEREYTELKEVSVDPYSVKFGLSQDTKEMHGLKAFDGYSYVTVSFSGSSDGDTETDVNDPKQTDYNSIIMNFTGNYRWEDCLIEIGTEDGTDASIHVTWKTGDSETTEYSMSGIFDPDTFRINYSDSEKKVITYNENGSVKNEKVEYSDGVGRIQFYGDGTLSWQDEQEIDKLISVLFEIETADI